MSLNETKQQVRSYILDEFLPGEDPGQLTDDLPLISGRILDSLATLKLVAHLEDAFGVEFAAHEVGPENLNTVALISAFVESKRKA